MRRARWRTVVLPIPGKRPVTVALSVAVLTFPEHAPTLASEALASIEADPEEDFHRGVRKLGFGSSAAVTAAALDSPDLPAHMTMPVAHRRDVQEREIARLDSHTVVLRNIGNRPLVKLPVALQLPTAGTILEFDVSLPAGSATTSALEGADKVVLILDLLNPGESLTVGLTVADCRAAAATRLSLLTTAK